MTKPACWIVDLDGTLALLGDRSPYATKGIERDQPNRPVIQVVQSLAANPQVGAIVLLSGRGEETRAQTERWLARWEIPYDLLIMRPQGDYRPDQVLKLQALRDQIEPHYRVTGVLEDRAKVVRMWRAQGLVCLQVAEGNF